MTGKDIVKFIEENNLFEYTIEVYMNNSEGVHDVLEFEVDHEYKTLTIY